MGAAASALLAHDAALDEYHHRARFVFVIGLSDILGTSPAPGTVRKPVRILLSCRSSRRARSASVGDSGAGDEGCDEKGGD
jgi:hypothetical protein